MQSYADAGLLPINEVNEDRGIDLPTMNVLINYRVPSTLQLFGYFATQNENYGIILHSQKKERKKEAGGGETSSLRINFDQTSVQRMILISSNIRLSFIGKAFTRKTQHLYKSLGL